MLRNTFIGISTLAVALGSAWAGEGDFLVRARLITVAPTGDATDILPSFAGSSVEVEDAFVPELDFTYFVSDRWAMELILATSPHDLNATGGLSGLGKVADVWALPPTLTMQYHFQPDEASVRPYIGAGLNYTIFYSEDATSNLEAAVGQTKVEVDSSVGFAVQAGVDIDINETWFINADIKYIQIETEATLTSQGLGASPVQTVNKVSVDINPVVAGIGIGRRF